MLYDHPVEITFICFVSEDPPESLFYIAFYAAKFDKEHDARSFHRALATSFVATLGAPEERTYYREKTLWPEDAMPPGTLPTALIADFGCRGSDAESPGYALTVDLNYPLPARPHWEVVMYMRFGDGVC
jgi:hypothetical protein